MTHDWFRPFVIAAALCVFAPAHAQDAGEETESAASTETAAESESDAGEGDAAAALADAKAEADADLIRRHHEGDVAMGVCGGRLSALMWFYQASVEVGRDDLKGALDSVSSSREAIKAEAERRATEDGVDTTVRVMNEQSAEIWETLVEASEEPEEFQKVHDTLFAEVEECLDLFFTRQRAPATDEGGDQDEADTDAEATDTDSEENDAAAE